VSHLLPYCALRAPELVPSIFAAAAALRSGPAYLVMLASMILLSTFPCGPALAHLW